MRSEYITNNETAKTSNFLLRYILAKRHGVENLKNEEFTYSISVSGNIFRNREEENPIGFYGFDLDNEDIRRFRWDRVEEIITVTE